MTSISLRFGKLVASIKKSSYFVREYMLYVFSDRSKIRILFSHHKPWVGQIARSFRFTRTKTTFQNIISAPDTGYDLIVPLTVSDLDYLSIHPEMFPDNAIPFPSAESLRICNDKALFDSTLRDRGYSSVLPALGSKLPIPYMLKKKNADDGDYCFFIRTEADEKSHARYLGEPDFFCQQIISGPVEYATHVLFKNGAIAASLNIKYVFKKDLPIKGKDGYAYRTISDCPHLELFADILKSIGFEGLCCFNYKEIDGKPYILEINPRFGGSLCMFFFSFIRKMEINHSAEAGQDSSRSTAILVRMPPTKPNATSKGTISSRSKY